MTAIWTGTASRGVLGGSSILRIGVDIEDVDRVEPEFVPVSDLRVIRGIVSQGGSVAQVLGIGLDDLNPHSPRIVVRPITPLIGKPKE